MYLLTEVFGSHLVRYCGIAACQLMTFNKQNNKYTLTTAYERSCDDRQLLRSSVSVCPAMIV